MKFIYNGSYTTFDGHEFMFGKPTDVVGKGTIEKLLKDERFTKCDDYLAERYAGFESAGVPLPKTCSKCGKEFPRGLFMHTKYCKGSA